MMAAVLRRSEEGGSYHVKLALALQRGCAGMASVETSNGT